ncbi:hypothetical protein BDV95DRAFT_611088 [Massariosphaeria phaeospora]|uniref:Uncharacterized protein n=1 Tax=Massariosphaeria phaeospora TaxID=100035 RepID=A0A7C8I0C4_9PLEO|nr:hypothetical protein BDV95DRAFT_611088 [Massariosphaeria phaeospora]
MAKNKSKNKNRSKAKNKNKTRGNRKAAEESASSDDDMQFPGTSILTPPGSSSPDSPVRNRIVTDEPVTNELVTNEPVTNEPITNEPITNESVTNEPVTDEQDPEESNSFDWEFWVCSVIKQMGYEKFSILQTLSKAIRTARRTLRDIPGQHTKSPAPLNKFDIERMFIGVPELYDVSKFEYEFKVGLMLYIKHADIPLTLIYKKVDSTVARAIIGIMIAYTERQWFFEPESTDKWMLGMLLGMQAEVRRRKEFKIWTPNKDLDFVLVLFAMHQVRAKYYDPAYLETMPDPPNTDDKPTADSNEKAEPDDDRNIFVANSSPTSEPDDKTVDAAKLLSTMPMSSSNSTAEPADKAKSDSNDNTLPDPNAKVSSAPSDNPIYALDAKTASDPIDKATLEAATTLSQMPTTTEPNDKPTVDPIDKTMAEADHKITLDANVTVEALGDDTFAAEFFIRPVNSSTMAEAEDKSTSDANDKSTSDANGKSTPDADDTSTSNADDKILPDANAGTVTVEALGDDTFAAEFFIRPVNSSTMAEADDKSTSDANGKSTPDADGESTPDADDKTTPDVDDKSSPVEALGDDPFAAAFFIRPAYS